MLKDTDIKLFSEGLPINVQMLLKVVSNKELWTQDSDDEVNAAISELSEIISEHEEVVIFADSASALSSMALMKIHRATVLLALILKYKPNFITEILNEPGQSAQDVQHKVIMINRLTFLARTNLVSEIFSKKNCELVRNQLAGV